MDIFKPFLDQEQVLATYRDGTTAPVKFLPTDRQLYGDSFPYTVTPGRITEYGGRGCLYASNGNCYFRGDADIVSIQPVNDVEQNMSYNYKSVLIGLAEILVAASPDDDQSDLVEEIYGHMDTNCREIMDEARSKQDNTVEELKEQIKELDSAAYQKLLEQLHLR
jgi:hypothetical protein